MENHEVRLLKADEIECRAALVKGNGLSLLLYKEARVDQRILDETFGPFGWKRSHQSINGNLFCTVEIFDREKNTWIGKQDVGTTAGNNEKEKSQASDSFKRACFNWGIGRELYTAPFIWIPSDKADIRQKDGKYYCNDRFRVKEVKYGKDREITALTVVNVSQGNRVVYEMGKASGKEGKASEKEAKTAHGDGAGMPPQGKAAENRLSPQQMDTLANELKRTGVDISDVKERYKINNTATMSPEIYERVMAALSKTKSLAA